jgi:hypothetical protein
MIYTHVNMNYIKVYPQVGCQIYVNFDPAAIYWIITIIKIRTTSLAKLSWWFALGL